MPCIAAALILCFAASAAAQAPRDARALVTVVDVTGAILPGATVTLVDEDTDEERKFQIVGDVESDAKRGRISLSSPIARALIGKSKGDTVEVAAPGGARSYEILKVEFI